MAPENLQTETLLATKILNISCATLVAVSQEILLGYQNCYLTLWLRRFVYNCNVVCGIIPDVMTLSSGWRHFYSNVTLLTFLLFYSGSICAIYVSYLKLCNLIIMYLSNLFLKKIKIKVNFLPKGHMCP